VHESADIFSAIADPTRRSILEVLATHEALAASDIYDRYPVSPQAISRHLKILREAQLVIVEKRAQQRIYRINPAAFSELEDWTAGLRKRWNQRLDALEKVLDEEWNNTRGMKDWREKTMQTDRLTELTMTRIFKQPREFVFRGWTDPRLFAKWWGPEMFSNSACELDVRPGGAIRLDMIAPDGTVYPFRGVYDEIAEPEKLVFTGGSFLDEAGHPQLESRTTVLFDDVDGQTKLTVHTVITKAVPGLEQPLSGMQEGWMTSLERLERVLAQYSNETLGR